MNNDKGELTKKAELLEIEFLQEMGVDTLGKYPDVEKHIDRRLTTLQKLRVVIPVPYYNMI